MAVWTVGAALLVFDLSLVTRFVTPGVPYGDELSLGSRKSIALDRPTLAWLWEQYAEHRVPLPKLIWASVLNTSDYDFRVGCYLNVLGLGLLAAALLMAARRLRGHWQLVDAFFPLAVLNPGQVFCFLWWWCINQILAPIVAGFLLILIVTRGQEFRPRDALLAGLLLVLLGICGPQGLPYILLLSPWLMARVLTSNWMRSAGLQQSIGLLSTGLAGLALLLLGLYFVGYAKKLEFWGSGLAPEWSLTGLWGTAAQCLRILTVGLGTAANSWWPLAGSGVLVLALVSLAVLVPVWLWNSLERWRALGLSAFVAAGGCVVLTVAWARSNHTPDYIQIGHYLMMSAPALCAISFIWVCYGPTWLRSTVRAGLFGVAALLLWPNGQYSLEFAAGHHGFTTAFAADLRAGVPAFMLAERYGATMTGMETPFLDPETYVPTPFLDSKSDRSWITPIFEKFHADGCGLFRQLRLTPRFESLPVTITPAPRGLLWEDGLARRLTSADADTPALVYSLPQARKVYAIRLHYRFEEPIAPPFSLQVGWGQNASGQFPATAPQFQTSLTDQMHAGTLTIWVNEVLDSFLVCPDTKPFVFRPLLVQLLVPVAGAEETPGWAELVMNDAAILDDGRPGHTQSGGGWHFYGDEPCGYGNGLRFALPGTGSNKTAWEMCEVPPGRYVVQTTWTVSNDRASNATYRLYDGETLATIVVVDQRARPSGPVVQGSAFQDLATIAVNTGRLRVELDDKADGVVIADAIRIVHVP